MSKSKIFVFAATGDQGFSTCRYLLEDGGFDVVGLSRNPESEKSKGILPFVLFALLEWSLIDGGTAELTNMGVKVVKGDLENVSSYAQHLEGMDGAFINADFWAKYYTNGFDAPAAGKYEETCSRSATDACVKAGVKHMVYSTLEDIPDKLTCEHLNSKARVTKYMEENKLPVTQLYTSTYYSNVTKFYQLEKKDDGSFLLTTPIPDDCGLVIFAVEQTGLWVRAAFKDPAKWIGKDIHACSEVISLADLAKVLSEVSGKKIETSHISKEAFYDPALAQKVTPELWINYDFFYRRLMKRDVAASKAVVPEQWDCKAWAQNSSQLKEALGI